MEDSMTNVWITLPEPPPGRQWCMACAMFAKAVINDQYGPQILTLAKDGKNEDLELAPQVVPHLEPASVRGLCGQLQQLGIMELCWTHLAGVAIQPISPLDPQYQQGGMPAGLITGRR
jgi:hypothetical protein